MVCPFCRRPWVKIPCHAVWEATGTEAASSKERLDGFLAMAAALTARYSAYAPIPLVVPNTASPGAHAETSTRYSLKCQSSWRALASTATPIIERPAGRDGERLPGKIAFPELPNGIDDRRLANPTPCGIR